MQIFSSHAIIILVPLFLFARAFFFYFFFSFLRLTGEFEPLLILLVVPPSLCRRRPGRTEIVIGIAIRIICFRIALVDDRFVFGFGVGGCKGLGGGLGAGVRMRVPQETFKGP